MKQILLVEDEKVLAKNIAFFLNKEGYHVEIAYDGEQGMKLFSENRYDLLLLDWNLPRMDGLELCRRIRKDSMVPIIMITAREETMDKVIGLEVGADDYIVKPFHQRELLARIHAIFRREQRYQEEPSQQLSYDGIECVREQMMLRYKGKQVELTATEYKLVDAMMSRPQHVFSREWLFEHIWGTQDGYSDRTVDVSISRLRKKLFDLTGRRYLHAVRGLGYRFGGEQ